jgi:hypothetical protein
MAFAVRFAARLSLCDFTTRQASLHATDRPVAPPIGLLTLGFDAGRFPPTPPVCYRASWQLPGKVGGWLGVDWTSLDSANRPLSIRT